MDEKAIRALLGIDEEADIGAAISGLQATIEAQKAVIETDQPSADKAAIAKLRNDLAEAQRRVLSGESETKQRIAAIEEDRRVEKARHKVENLVTRGKVTPANEEMALDLALHMPEEKFDAWVATLQGVDLSERGVASASDLASFEPTKADYDAAKAMGVDSSTHEWRIATMRNKAQAQGLTLPAEVK